MAEPGLRRLFIALCAIGLVGAAPALWSQTSYYRSNGVASQIEAVGDFDADLEYLLRVTRSRNSREEALFSFGEQIRREVTTFRPQGGTALVERYQEGSLAERTEYDLRGRPAVLEEYNGGRLSRRTTYEYSGENLALARVFSGDETLLYEDRYLYSASGALREVERVEADGSRRLSDYTFGDGSLVREWHGSEEAGELVLYDQRGRLVGRRSYVGTEAALLVEYSYAGPEATNPATSRTQNIPRGETTLTRYTPEGLTEYEEVTRDGAVVQTRTYRYSQGRLVERTTTRDGVSETLAYEYDEEGNRVAESILVNGTLQLRTEFADEGYVEERYRDGELFLRVYYGPDDNRLREEIIRDGEILRTRVFDESPGSGAAP